MKNITLKKLLIILIPVLLAAVLVFKLKKNKSEATAKVYKYDKNTPISVSTQFIALSSLGSEIEFTGTFEANRETRLSAEIQGKINNISVDAGSYVKTGQQLIKLDDAILKQQLRTSEVMIENLKAETEIQLQNNAVQISGLEADVKRYSVLAASDAIQGVQLEKAEIQLKNAQNQRKTLQQQSAIKNAEAQKAGIFEQIRKSSVYAPFAGVITAKMTEVGSFAAPGIPLLQLSEIGTLKFTINVPEADLSQFALGQNYLIVPDAYNTTQLTGKVTMIGSKANPGNSFPVQLTLSNLADQKIKSGMLGRVKKTAENGIKELIIPAVALQGSASSPKVYLNKNGKAILVPVKIKKRTDNRVIIESGISTGDEIITGGFINLFEGANIIKN